MPAVKRPESEQLAMESVVAAAAIPAPDFAPGTARQRWFARYALVCNIESCVPIPKFASFCSARPFANFGIEGHQHLLV
jgi:hypothetical protein